jgi:hypothetical protein
MPLRRTLDEVLAVDECAAGFLVKLFQNCCTASPRHAVQEQKISGLQSIAEDAVRRVLSGN